MFEETRPRQMILVGSRGEVNVMGKTISRDNLITIEWHTPLSLDPELYGIVIRKSRFSYKLINESKVFTVNFIPVTHSSSFQICGTTSGMNTDKFVETGLTKEESESIDCCRVQESVSYLECQLIDELPAGDHVILVGKVLKRKVNNINDKTFHKGDGLYVATK